jgi:uncharacterized protein YbaR (Trm112 family)
MIDDKLLDILACPFCVRQVVLVEMDREGYAALVADGAALGEKAAALNGQRRFSGHQPGCGGTRFTAVTPPVRSVTDPKMAVGQVRCAGCATVFTLVPSGILPPQSEPREGSTEPPVRLVEVRDEKIVCLNPACGKRYPIRDDIPVMLIDEAEEPTAAGADAE